MNSSISPKAYKQQTGSTRQYSREYDAHIFVKSHRENIGVIPQNLAFRRADEDGDCFTYGIICQFTDAAGKKKDYFKYVNLTNKKISKWVREGQNKQLCELFRDGQLVKLYFDFDFDKKVDGVLQYKTLSEIQDWIIDQFPLANKKTMNISGYTTSEKHSYHIIVPEYKFIYDAGAGNGVCQALTDIKLSPEAKAAMIKAKAAPGKVTSYKFEKVATAKIPADFNYYTA
ncbi:hypothetical protein H9P43_009119, partial [Blastocladiella emersonii ATCC 22665]